MLLSYIMEYESIFTVKISGFLSQQGVITIFSGCYNAELFIILSGLSSDINIYSLYYCKSILNDSGPGVKVAGYYYLY